MWNPKTEEDILSGIASGLEETDTLDFKKELGSKNIDIAKDVAAMANSAGGTIVYGVGEDEAGRPNVVSPFLLKNQCETIDNVIKTGISEVPFAQIHPIPTTIDGSVGFIVVTVPASDRAPHMVIIKGESRYYGRSSRTNKILSEPDIARLYSRRLEVDRDIGPFLDVAIDCSPTKEFTETANLHIAIRPIFPDLEVLYDAVKERNRNEERQTAARNEASATASQGEEYYTFPPRVFTVEELLADVVTAAKLPAIFPHSYSPDLMSSDWIIEHDGYRSMPWHGDRTSLMYYRVKLDGSGVLFSSHIARKRKLATDDDNKVLVEDALVGITTRFVYIFGLLYDLAGYAGKVDIGAHLCNLQGTTALLKHTDFVYREPVPFNQDTFRKAVRVNALEMILHPKNVSASLFERLILAVSQGASNPFK